MFLFFFIDDPLVERKKSHKSHSLFLVHFLDDLTISSDKFQYSWLFPRGGEGGGGFFFFFIYLSHAALTDPVSFPSMGS